MSRELTELNEAIGVAESAGDRAFFEQLLHPQFVMIRPNGAVADRRAFIDGLAADARRATSGVLVVEYPHRRAVVQCTVVKWSGPAETPPPDAPRYDNLRLFWKTEDGWRLVAWVNEPSP
ncbi:MAG: nuclear transport factor 2 family protein [Actinomycetes bacterium]